MKREDKGKIADRLVIENKGRLQGYKVYDKLTNDVIRIMEKKVVKGKKNRAYKKSDFKKHIESLKIDGFKLKSDIQAYLFIREHSNRTETIIVMYSSYAPDGFYIEGISAHIYFPEVEDILEIYGLGKIFKSTLNEVFQDLKDVDYKKLDTKINSEETFNSVKEAVEDILEKGVKPFLSRFATVGEIADFLADKEASEIALYIQGSILFPKTVLIMKLAKRPDFKKRLIEFRNVLSERAPKYGIDQIMLNKYNELFAEDLKSLTQLAGICS